MPAHKIFCLEGGWDEKLTDRTSVLPILELLERVQGVRFIHRDVAMPDEFEYLLTRWCRRRYQDYSVGYFAFHGRAGAIELARDEVQLEELAELCRDSLAGRVIYFGSCRTVLASADRLAEFKKVSGARYVCGYTKDVDWIGSASFDVLLLSALTFYTRFGDALRYLGREHKAFADSLGFMYQ